MAPSKQPAYSKENVKNAIDAVNNGMSYYRAAQLFNVPKTTLIYKKTGKIPIDRKMGPETYLSNLEETLLVNWIFHISGKGFPPTKDCLLDSVQLLVKELQRKTPFVNGRPGRRWYESFLKRHPEVTRRVSQNLPNLRAKISEEKIRNWFDEIRQYFSSNEFLDILEYPQRIFNCDETAVYLSPKDNKVLVKKGEKAVYSFTNNDDKECITTLFMCSANGTLPPPMILHNYKRMPAKVAVSMPKSWGLGHTESGWMTGESFFEYIVNVFWPWLEENKITLPIVLFLDGHVSHMTMALSEFCSKKGIILVALLPNATHVLQPLDVAFFRPFKLHWKNMVYQWRIANSGQKMQREDFAPLLNKSLDTMPNKEQVINNGFRTSGLFPFSPENIDYKKFFKKSYDISKNVIDQSQQHKEKYKQLLNLLEREIPTKVSKFITSGDFWQGNIEDTSLFNFWKQIKIKSGSPITSENLENTTISKIDTLTDNLISEVLEENPNISNLDYDMIIDITENELEEININKPDFSSTPLKAGPIIITVESEKVTLAPEEARSNVETLKSCCLAQNVLNEVDQNVQNVIEKTPEEYPKISVDKAAIPTPFKKCLFWSPEHKKDEKKGRSKEKIPSVATSADWQSYYKKKNEEKKKKDKEQEKRKNDREQKKREREKKTTSRNCRKTNEKKDPSEEEKYFIVKYDDQFYPGLLIENDKKNQKLKIRTMEKNGLNWKWPVREDVLWYKKEDVLESIKHPRMVNKRGSYYIQEMSKYDK